MILDSIVNEIALELFGGLGVKTDDISREGSWIAYTGDYDLWIADRFRVHSFDKEFYIWIKGDDWGIIPS